MTQEPQPPRRRGAFIAATLAALPLFSAGAAHASPLQSWPLGVSWWLPQDYSKHGPAIDSLFNWIFWITMVTFVAVQVTLVVFLIKYRHRPGAKGVFIHGNTRLEMAWTLAPAVILALLAFFSKGVWTNYRYAQDFRGPGEKAADVMVIGQQFKWNVVYPGKDGKFGRYLLFPKPTDWRWPDGKDHFGAKGPRFLKHGQAIDSINKYIDQDNPLGKDLLDPDGKDDDWQGSLGRILEVPAGRPVDVTLSSKDVIHSFTLVNYRVKLDTVPGMRGMISFTPTETTAEREAKSKKIYPVDELLAIAKNPKAPEWRVYVDDKTPSGEHANFDTRAKEWRYVDAKKATIIRTGRTLTPDNLQKLKDNGVTQIVAYNPGSWEISCEELCGQGHYTMRGEMVVLSPEEYARKYEGATATPTPPAPGAPKVTMAH